MNRNSLGMAFAVFLAPTLAMAQAQTEDQTLIDACKATGLVALKQKTPSVSDVFLDMDSLSVIQADTKIEDTPVKAIILGDAYLQKGAKTGKPYRLICIVGDKGKVLMTYFTLQ